MTIHETETDDEYVCIEDGPDSSFFVFRASDERMDSFKSFSLITAMRVYCSWASRSLGLTSPASSRLATA